MLDVVHSRSELNDFLLGCAFPIHVSIVVIRQRCSSGCRRRSQTRSQRSLVGKMTQPESGMKHKMLLRDTFCLPCSKGSPPSIMFVVICLQLPVPAQSHADYANSKGICGMGCGASAVADRPIAAKVEDPNPDDTSEENWAWSKTVLERFAVKGVDVLGVGSFSVVRKGVDMSTGQAVAVKALKASSIVKFRREVFLFDALFMPENPDTKGARGIERSPTVLLGQMEYKKCRNPFASSNPQDLFVQLLAHSNLGSESEDAWTILELGDFTLHDTTLG